MADIKNQITLGIGSAPGNIRYFVLVGLDVNPVSIEYVDLVAPPRPFTLDANARSFTLTALVRPA